MAAQIKTQGEWIRGTAKQIQLHPEGLLLGQPFIYGGTDINGPVTDGGNWGQLGARYERAEVSSAGIYGYDANNTSTWLGGVATRFWAKRADEAPHASEVEAEDGLDGLTFPELMEIAKGIKLRGRGTARKPQLVAGIRAHRAA